MSVTDQLEGRCGQRRELRCVSAPAPGRGVVTMGSVELALAYSERSPSLMCLLRWWR
jgi:hypothetical protein